MKYYDLIRKEPDEEMLSVAKKLGLELLFDLKGVFEVDDPREGVKLLPKAKALFVKRINSTLLSLAKQRGVHIGIFISDVNERNLRHYGSILRLLERHRIPVLLASGARELLEIRSPKDIAMVGILLGLRRENAFAAVSKRWGVILEAP